MENFMCIITEAKNQVMEPEAHAKEAIKKRTDTKLKTKYEVYGYASIATTFAQEVLQMRKTDERK